MEDYKNYSLFMGSKEEFKLCDMKGITPQLQSNQPDGCRWPGAYLAPGHMQLSWHEDCYFYEYTCSNASFPVIRALIQYKGVILPV